MQVAQLSIMEKEGRNKKPVFLVAHAQITSKKTSDSPLSSWQATCNTNLIMGLYPLLLGKARIVRLPSGERMLIWIYEFCLWLVFCSLNPA